MTRVAPAGPCAHVDQAPAHRCPRCVRSSSTRVRSTTPQCRFPCFTDVRRNRLRQPIEHDRRVVDLLGDEVPGALDAMNVGLRHPLEQIAQVDLTEHGIARTPEDERRDAERSDTRGDAVELVHARVRRRRQGCRRRSRGFRAAVRTSCTANGMRRGRPGRAAAGRATASSRGTTACPLSQGPSTPGASAARSGAGIDRPSGWCTAVLSSTTPERRSGWSIAQPRLTGAAPVVSDGDHRSRQAERIGEGGEIGDPIGETAKAPGPFGVAHLELVDRDHPPGGADTVRLCGIHWPPRAVDATGTTRWGCRERTEACRPERCPPRRARDPCRADATRLRPQ